MMNIQISNPGDNPTFICPNCNSFLKVTELTGDYIRSDIDVASMHICPSCGATLRLDTRLNIGAQVQMGGVPYKEMVKEDDIPATKAKWNKYYTASEDLEYISAQYNYTVGTDASFTTSGNDPISLKDTPTAVPNKEKSGWSVTKLQEDSPLDKYFEEDIDYSEDDLPEEYPSPLIKKATKKISSDNFNDLF